MVDKNYDMWTRLVLTTHLALLFHAPILLTYMKALPLQLSYYSAILLLNRMILCSTPLVMIVTVISIGASEDYLRLSKPRLSKHSITEFKSSSITDSAQSSTISRMSQAAGMRTSGWVEMIAKIDMRAVLELLNELPEMKRILIYLSEKVGTFDKEIILTAIIREISGLKEIFGSGFYDMNKIIRDLFQMLQEGPLNSSEKKLLRILEYLEINSQKPVQCELSEIERNFGSFVATVENLRNQIQKEMIIQMKNDEQGLAAIMDNGELLTKILSLLEAMDQRTAKGLGSGNCEICQVLSDILMMDQDSYNILKQLGNMVQEIYRDIGLLMRSDGGFGAFRKDVLTIIKIEEDLQGSILQLNERIDTLNGRIEKFFSEHQRIIIDTKYAVSETGKFIQKSAASTEQQINRLAYETSRAASKAAGRSCN